MSLLLAGGYGASPYDTLISGVSQRFGTGPGTAAWLAGIGVCLLAAAMGRIPSVGTLIGVFTVGVVVNTAGQVIEPAGTAAHMLCSAAGLATLLLGISLGAASTVGAGPVEVVEHALAGHGAPARSTRFALDAGVLGTGMLLGGVAGIGTVVFLLAAPTALRRLTPLAEQLAGTADHPARRALAVSRS